MIRMLLLSCLAKQTQQTTLQSKLTNVSGHPNQCLFCVSFFILPELDFCFSSQAHHPSC